MTTFLSTRRRAGFPAAGQVCSNLLAVLAHGGNALKLTARCLSLILLLSAPLAAAEELDPPMTRIEYRTIAPTIPTDSPAAKPRVLYIAGTIYSRMEEPPDPSRGGQRLMIVNEPDAWAINLSTQRGQHIIDPGPSYVVIHQILDREAPKELSNFEFGKEAAFFRNQHATPLPAQTLDGQRCDVSECKSANYRLVLFLKAGSPEPFHLDIFKDNALFFSIRYLSYRTGLKFDEALFTLPANIQVTEAEMSK